LRLFDVNQNGKISKDELNHVMRSPKTVRALEALDVDVECLRELHEALIKGAEVTIDGIMELLLSYRGGLPCTVKHVVEAQVFTRWDLSRQMRLLWSKIHREMHECHLVVTDLSQRLVREPVGDTLELQSVAAIGRRPPRLHIGPPVLLASSRLLL